MDTDTYTYDLTGNRKSKTHTGSGGNETITYSYNGDDELTSQTSTVSGTTNFSYDANGSQIDDGTHKYVYDVRNKMVKITDESGNVIAVANIGALG